MLSHFSFPVALVPSFKNPLSFGCCLGPFLCPLSFALHFKQPTRTILDRQPPTFIGRVPYPYPLASSRPCPLLFSSSSAVVVPRYRCSKSSLSLPLLVHIDDFYMYACVSPFLGSPQKFDSLLGPSCVSQSFSSVSARFVFVLVHQTLQFSLQSAFVVPRSRQSKGLLLFPCLCTPFVGGGVFFFLVFFWAPRVFSLFLPVSAHFVSRPCPSNPPIFSSRDIDGQGITPFFYLF